MVDYYFIRIVITDNEEMVVVGVGSWSERIGGMGHTWTRINALVFEACEIERTVWVVDTLCLANGVRVSFVGRNTVTSRTAIEGSTLSIHSARARITWILHNHFRGLLYPSTLSQGVSLVPILTRTESIRRK